MNAGEHTPGPWYAYLPRGADAGCRLIRTEAGRAHGTYRGTEVACTSGLSDDAQDAANARLIAAAPDLAVALEAAMPDIRTAAWNRTPYFGDDPQERDIESDPVLAAARAALQKAGRP